LSGLLLVLSFPKFGHPLPAWIALVPLIAAIDRDAVRQPQAGLLRATLLGLVTGVVFFTGTLYWITTVMITYGGLQPAVAVAVNALLVGYLAWFPAGFAAALSYLRRRLDVAALLLAPAVWVASEAGRGWLFGGFPWVLLGYSQVTVLPVAQLASLVGVFGVSGLVASISSVIVYAASITGRSRWIAVAAAVVMLAVVTAWGIARLADGSLTRSGEPLSVGLIQGNIAQEQKWDPKHAGAILRTYLNLTREAAAGGARFIIWPESATPFYFEEDPVGAEEVRRVARETGADILLGSDQLERGEVPKYYNAAFLVRSDGTTAAVYRKMHLVPFGEFVPLKDLLFFASPLVESVSDFSAGTEAVLLPVGGRRGSTAICYEVVYPALVREFVLAGSELLTTITNDAWYGDSSAPYQHFAQASMRAIENGRYLARSANTGISGIVDPYGRVTVQSRLFERVTLAGNVRFLTVRTIYARIGDAFAYGCVVLTLAALAASVRGRGRR
jgi:apolipoprotein N-acyltransferase